MSIRRPTSYGQTDRGKAWEDTSCLCICHYDGPICDDATCASTLVVSAANAPVIAASPARPAIVASAPSRTTRTTIVATPIPFVIVR